MIAKGLLVTLGIAVALAVEQAAGPPAPKPPEPAALHLKALLNSDILAPDEAEAVLLDAGPSALAKARSVCDVTHTISDRFATMMGPLRPAVQGRTAVVDVREAIGYFASHCAVLYLAAGLDAKFLDTPLACMEALLLQPEGALVAHRRALVLSLAAYLDKPREFVVDTGEGNVAKAETARVAQDVLWRLLPPKGQVEDMAALVKRAQQWLKENPEPKAPPLASPPASGAPPPPRGPQ